MSRRAPFPFDTRDHVRAMQWAHLLGCGSHLQVLLEGPAGALLVGKLLLQGGHLGSPLRRLSLQLLPQRRCLRGAGLRSKRLTTLRVEKGGARPLLVM